MLILGKTVFGKDRTQYKVEKQIGAGGFGHVFLVKNNENSLALKTANADGISADEYDALKNEGALALSVEHENVIKVHYFHDGKEHSELPPYLLMDLANGGTLKEFISSRTKSNALLSENELTTFITQICNGMKAINNCLIHRDFHPGNVLFQENTLKITDFGLSKLVDTVTRTNTFKGIQHIYYKAPESWKMHKNTIQMDMYSAGIVFYELATLQYPFKLENQKDKILEIQEAHFFSVPVEPKSINRNLPDALNELIMRLLKKRPNDRPKNWQEVLSYLSEPVENSTRQIDVGNLVARARATDQAIEDSKIKEERSKNEHEQKIKSLKLASSTIKEIISEIVAAFNSQTQVDKLSIHDFQNNIGFSVQAEKTGRSVTCSLGLAENVIHQEQDTFGREIQRTETLKFNGQDIQFWGCIQNDAGQGLNLLLTFDDKDDLYGSWKILRHKWNALNSRRDNRPEPFPLTEWSEFAHQVAVIRALGLIDTEIRPFELEQFKFLFEEIL